MNQELWISFGYDPESNLDSMIIVGVYDTKKKAIDGILQVCKNWFDICTNENNIGILLSHPFEILNPNSPWVHFEKILKKKLNGKEKECTFGEYLYHYTNAGLNETNY